MCNVCGCGSGETRIEGEGAKPAYRWAPVGRSQATRAQAELASTASAQAAGGEESEGSLHFGHGPAGAHVPGMSQAQMVKIEQDILARNDGFAAENRRWLAERGVLALNLVSSPGSGKTSLLVRTIAALQALPQPVPVSVVEGDQQTSFDAERIRATGAPALQINTGKGCHLDGHMVGEALDRFPDHGAQLFILDGLIHGAAKAQQPFVTFLRSALCNEMTASQSGMAVFVHVERRAAEPAGQKLEQAFGTAR